ncbi:protein ECT2 isoform X4 [Silurus meridionalis]|nr:protein ECT2 isoform X4 [Silurus meridionalis]
MFVVCCSVMGSYMLNSTCRLFIFITIQIHSSSVEKKKETGSLVTESGSDTMADSTFGTMRSLLVDSSVFDSRMAESSREQTFFGLTSDDAEEILRQVKTRVVLVKDAGGDAALEKAIEAIRVMEVPVVKIKEGDPSSESGEKLIKSLVNMDINVPCIKTDNVREFGDGENAEYETVFVLKDFQSPDYSYLYKNDNRILGPPVPLPFSSRPLYSTTMLNLSLCFTGFRKKEEVVNLVNLVHHMGGTIRKDFSAKVTHLIAHSTHGEKYRLAVCMGTPILTPDWIHKAWEQKDNVNFHAGDEEFRMAFKVPPFQDCVLSFLGFSEEEKSNMEERTLKHGGRFLEVGDEKCTHLVVEENSIKELPFVPSKRLYVVKQEWFWGSIQMDARAGESMYSYEKSDSPVMKKAVSLLSLTTPTSNRKRRRLRDTLAQLTKETEISPFPPRKRPSAEHSLSMGSLLDISNTPDTCKGLTVQMARSASTFSLSGCSKNAVVQRSNSLDNAPRPRLSVCVRSPCGPENTNQPAPSESHLKVPVQKACPAALQGARPCRDLVVSLEQRRLPGSPRRETLL